MLTRPPSQAYNPPPAMANNSPTVDPGVTSLVQLLQVSTVNLSVPFMKVWINVADGTSQIWVLMAYGGGGGCQFPNDYNASTNNKAWYKSST